MEPPLKVPLAVLRENPQITPSLSPPHLTNPILSCRPPLPTPGSSFSLVSPSVSTAMQKGHRDFPPPFGDPPPPSGDPPLSGDPPDSPQPTRGRDQDQGRGRARGVAGSSFPSQQSDHPVKDLLNPLGDDPPERPDLLMLLLSSLPQGPHPHALLPPPHTGPFPPVILPPPTRNDGFLPPFGRAPQMSAGPQLFFPLPSFHPPPQQQQAVCVGNSLGGPVWISPFFRLPFVDRRLLGGEMVPAAVQPTFAHYGPFVPQFSPVAFGPEIFQSSPKYAGSAPRPPQIDPSELHSHILSRVPLDTEGLLAKRELQQCEATVEERRDLIVSKGNSGTRDVPRSRRLKGDEDIYDIDDIDNSDSDSHGGEGHESPESEIEPSDGGREDSFLSKGSGRKSARGDPTDFMAYLAETTKKATEGDQRHGHREIIMVTTTTRAGSGRYLCTFLDCGRSYARSEHLGRHLRCHIQGKVYVCNRCFKKFNRTDSLLQHQKIHLKVAPTSG